MYSIQAEAPCVAGADYSVLRPVARTTINNLSVSVGSHSRIQGRCDLGIRNDLALVYAITL